MSILDRFGAAWEAFRASRWPKPDGPGDMPGYRSNVIDNPWALTPVALEYPKAMRIVGVVRACIMRKAEDMAALPLVVESQAGKDWKPLEREPGNLLDVLLKGNPMQSGREVLRDWHANYYGHGNGYLVAERFGRAIPSELWVMPSHLVEVVPGPRRSVNEYLFRNERRVSVDDRAVIHWRAFNSEDEPIGSSSLESVQLQYETRHDLMRLLQKIVRNGGVAAGHYRIPAQNGQSVALSEPEKKAMAQTLKRSWGIRNIDMPKILDVLEFERTGLTLPEMQFLENINLLDADVARALGVPPWLIGIKEGNALGNTAKGSDSDERIYWMNNRTEIEIRDALLTERLAPMFGTKLRVRADLSHIIALNKPLIDVAQNVVSLTGGRSVFTPNEVRRMLGQPPIDDPAADELYVAPAPSFGGPGAGASKVADSEPAPVKKAEQRLIDTPERAERWRQKDRLIAVYEKKLRSAFTEAILGRRDAIISYLEAETSRALVGSRTLDLASVMEPDPDDEKRIQQIYLDLIAARGAQAGQEIALELELRLQAQAVQNFLLARKTVGLDSVLETLLRDARASLAEGIVKSEGFSDLAARVRTVFDDALQSRIVTIARTETVSAFNFATVEAWAQSGEVESVEWLSARDNAVRETHAAADGQVVKLGQPFLVGGSALDFPGDPGAPADETINCRCTVLPVLSERARARRWKRYFGTNGTEPHTNGDGNRLVGLFR